LLLQQDLVEEMAVTMDSRLGNVTEMCRKVYRDKFGCDFDPKAYVVACMSGTPANESPIPPVGGDGHENDAVAARTTRAAAKSRGQSVEVFPDFIDFVDGCKSSRKKRKKGHVDEEAAGTEEPEAHVGAGVEDVASEHPVVASTPEAASDPQAIEILEPEEVAAAEQVALDEEATAKLQAENAKFRDLHTRLEGGVLAVHPRLFACPVRIVSVVV
jgi:hypothetical protein